MRPLKLTVEAFGPFAGKEIIDFTQIEDQQLFGIYGETGSGKSSIFEAIAFALFGKGLKKDLDDLRSDHSDMNTLCKVEFIFEASNNKYLVERSPKQSSETRKNIGAESYLFDITGIPLDDLSPTNRGRVLAEKKVSDTTEEIQNILGYGLEQFSQIVLLPQGEFEKFLLSTTDDKKKILGRLFDVSLYKNLAEKFAKDAKDVVEKKKALDQKREGQLSTQNLNTYEELEEKINEEKSKTKALKDRVSELKRDFDDIKKFKDKHEDLATKKSELSELMDKKPEFEEIKQNIDTLKNAEKLKPLHKDFKEKKSFHISIKEKLDTLVENFEKNEHELASNKKQKDEIKALKDTYSEKDTERQRLKNYKVSLVNSQNKQDELRSFEASIKTLSVYIDKRELEAQLTNVKAFEKKKFDFEEVEEGVRRLDNSTKELMRQLKLAEDTYQEAEQNLSEMQAIHLSRKLVEGEACPVCGSLDHPKPAKGQAESKGLNDAFEDARKQKNRIKIEYDKEMGELGHQKARLEASKDFLAEAKTPPLSSAEIEIKFLTPGL